MFNEALPLPFRLHTMESILKPTNTSQLPQESWDFSWPPLLNANRIQKGRETSVASIKSTGRRGRVARLRHVKAMTRVSLIPCKLSKGGKGIYPSVCKIVSGFPLVRFFKKIGTFSIPVLDANQTVYGLLLRSMNEYSFHSCYFHKHPRFQQGMPL